MTYRVICKPGGGGSFDYYVANSPPGRVIQGHSTSPLFDACRRLKLMGASPMARAALYHKGSPHWTVRCPIWLGEKSLYD